jgi:hypothetical protein
VVEDPPWAGLVTGLAGLLRPELGLAFLSEGAGPSYIEQFVLAILFVDVELFEI